MTDHRLRSSPVAELIRRERLVVVLRRLATERLEEIVADLAGMGARIFEITMDGADAAAALTASRARLTAMGDGPWVVGAGTILTRAQLDAAIGAGADFGVSPILDPELLATALDAGLPFVPGAYTPTEVETAWRLGATFVKLFPASSAGPSHLRELRGPLREIEIIPTGGIDAGNAGAFLAAGAVAVGVGSSIVNADRSGREALLNAVRGAA